MTDFNLFMMCERLNVAALSSLPAGYTIRSSTPTEFGVWKSFPFDTAHEAEEYDAYMDAYFKDVYAGRESEFFEATKFVCDSTGTPVATCAIVAPVRQK